jgi:heat shock protein HslJ
MIMKVPGTPAVVLASAVLASGCMHSSAASLPESGRWRLATAGDLALPASPVQFSIELAADSAALAGQVACNRWKGTRSGDGERFAVEHAASTRKRCPQGSEALNALERSYLGRLAEGATSSRQDDTWVLTFADGTRWVFVTTP